MEPEKLLILDQEHHPEFRLVTTDIEEVFKKASSTHAEFLHPDLRVTTPRPWQRSTLTGEPDTILLNGEIFKQ